MNNQNWFGNALFKVHEGEEDFETMDLQLFSSDVMQNARLILAS